MSREYFVLDDKHQLRAADPFLDDREAKRVGATEIGEVFVSTVFIGVDHSLGYGPPLYFETMVFRGPYDEWTWRYTTWDEAAAGHAAIVAAISTGKEPPER